MRGCFGSKICGFRPTGRLHLGHYFSVIKPALEGCTVLIANFHAPEEKSVEENISLLQSFGVKNFILQRDVFDPHLYFSLLSITSVAELERMPQFKSSIESKRTSQLLTYPVLMTHDLLGYEEVYVGEDQIPHVDFARKIIKKYDKTALCPKPIITEAKIRDLRKTSSKMSKSSPEGCLFLDDSPENIFAKIKRATMDELGAKNIEFLYKYFVKEDMPNSYGAAKTILSKSISEYFKPFRIKELG